MSEKQSLKGRKVLKSQKIFTLLLTFLLMFSALAIPLYAAQKDGLEAEIITSKSNYSANENIVVTVKLQNTNNFTMNNVNVEATLPNGLTLKGGKTSAKYNQLEASKTVDFSFTAQQQTLSPTNTPNNTGNTGNHTNGGNSGTTGHEHDYSTSSPVAVTPLPMQESTDTPNPTATVLDVAETSDNLQNEADTAPINSELITEINNTQLEVQEQTAEQEQTLEQERELAKKQEQEIAATSDSIDKINPNTVDTQKNNILITVVIFIIALFSVITICVLTYKTSKKATRVIAVFLCFASVMSALIGFKVYNTNADEPTTQMFEVKKDITVDGKNYTITAKVQYDVTNADSFVPSRDADIYVNDELFSGGSKNITFTELGDEFVNDQVIVDFKKETSEAEIEAFILQYSGVVVGKIGIINEYKIQLPKSYEYEELILLVEEIKLNPIVYTARINRILPMPDFSYIPESDKKWKDDWEISQGKNWGLKAINVDKAWDIEI